MTPSDDVAQIQRLAIEQAPIAPTLAQALADVAAMPYGFHASDLTHVSWWHARQRGYAACGEAAAWIAAAAIADGYADVTIHVVTGDPALCGPGYRHAVVVIDGRTYDPYNARACQAPAVSLAHSSTRWAL